MMSEQSLSPARGKTARADHAAVDPDFQSILTELRYLRTDVANVLKAVTSPMDTDREHPHLGNRSSEIPASNLPISAAPSELKVARVLRIKCLGAYRVWLDEAQLDMGISRKAQQIFRYLIAHGGGPVQREVLMEMLWPEAPQSQVRHRLNSALYALRQNLRHSAGHEQPIVLHSNGAYLLNPVLRLDVDADRFVAAIKLAETALAAGDEAVALSNYELADDLYAGDYMVDERYTDWARLTRQRLEDAHNTGLVKLSRLHMQRGDINAAIESVQRVLAVDVCYEEGYRILMRCNARAGRRAHALRQFVECVRALKVHLGVEPSERSLRLAEKIRNAEVV